MKLKTWLALAAGAVTLGFVAVPAQAAPVDGLHAFNAPAARMADVQQATWYRRHHYGYYYGPRHRYWRHHYYYGPRYHRRHWHYRYW